MGGLDHQKQESIILIEVCNVETVLSFTLLFIRNIPRPWCLLSIGPRVRIFFLNSGLLNKYHLQHRPAII